MAPSQHIRTQHIRNPLGNRRWTASIVLALGASLLMSGCDAKQSDTAAVVNGTAISEKDVQTVARQLSVFTGGRPLPTGSVLYGMIQTPFVLAESNRQRKSIPDQQVLQIIGRISGPSALTADFVKADLLLQQLDSASQAVLDQNMLRAKIVVNPRYGSYNPKDQRQGLLPPRPNWLKANASPGAR